MRVFYGLIFATLIACGSDTTPVEPPSGPITADIAVHLHVMGDSTLMRIGSPIYTISIDSTAAMAFDAQTGLSLTVRAGKHSLQIYRTLIPTILSQLLTGRPAQQAVCALEPPFIIASVFEAGSTTDVNFILHCPPVQAAGG